MRSLLESNEAIARTRRQSRKTGRPHIITPETCLHAPVTIKKAAPRPWADAYAESKAVSEAAIAETTTIVESITTETTIPETAGHPGTEAATAEAAGKAATVEAATTKASVAATKAAASAACQRHCWCSQTKRRKCQ
jgi:hypothetical protein